MHGLVRQRARARDDTDVAFFMNMRRHDADLALARRDNARTVRPDQPRVLRLEELPCVDHVHRGNAFGDADDQCHACVGGLHDGVGRTRRWNEDHGRVRAGLLHAFANRVEDGPALVSGAALAGSHASNNVGTVRGGVLRVERAFPSRQSLHQQARRFVDQNAHATPLAAATTFSAASFMVSATMNFSPLSFRIRRPSSTLVPSSRNTIGNWMLVVRAAVTMPLASVSTRRMPPKMLISTAFTFLSLSRISKACVTCSAFAPPPTSRKLAGMPPAY